MNNRSLGGLVVGAILALTCPRMANAAVIIDFQENGGTANAVKSVELTTTTASATGLMGCNGAVVPPPCISATINGGPGLMNGEEGPAEVDLNLPPGTFVTLAPGATPTTVLGYLMDRGGKTISDIVALRIINLAGLQTASITFNSNSTTSNFLPIPDGFVFNTAIEGMPTTASHVDISRQFFTGPADTPRDQRPYALPTGYMITALSDVDQIPEPSSLFVLGCGLIGLWLVACARSKT